MTRFIAAAALVGLVAFTANESSALTLATKRCITTARQGFRNALKNDRVNELNAFNAAYQGCCYGNTYCRRNKIMESEAYHLGEIG